MTGSTDERKLQIGVSVDTTDAKKGFQDIGAAATQMGKAVASAGDQAAASTNRATDAAVQAATKQDAATKNLIQSIQRKIAVEEAGSKSSGDFYRALAGQRGIDTAQLKPYLDQLDQVTAKNRAAQEALRATVPGFEQMGMSAKATTAALRGIPAQFTDIVTSLQGGQKPLTVLLQQGGQLKDMFGGIGPAAQALGGYVAGMINPFTLAAAAVGGLAYAYYKGSQEADEFRKSLILSGNAAGTTAATMAGYAESISKTVGTTGAAAAALAEMAASGRVAGGSLQAFSALALKMESTVGQSVSKTAEQFAELGRNPVAASEKLNEVYNYLTASVYAQIKALVEQGKATEAGALAQKSFADALDGRMGDIKSNMGIIESGWKSITDTIKGAGDALLSVGRAQTPAEQRAILVANLKNRQDRNATLGIKDGAGTEDLRQQIAYLDESERLNRRVASSKAEQAASTRSTIDWEKEGDKYLAPRAQMERDITAARNQGLAAGKSEVEIQARIAEIRKKYPTDNLDLSAQIEAIKQAERLKQEAYKQTAAVLEGEYKRGLMTEAEYLLQNVGLTLDGIDAQKAALQSQLALAKGKKDSQKEVASLTGQIAALEAKAGTESIKYGQQALDLQYKKLRVSQDLKEALYEEAAAAEQVAFAKASDTYMADLAAANSYTLAITDTTAQLKVEASTLSLTNEQRALALAQLQIEINRRQQLAGIKTTDAEDKAQLTAIIDNAAEQAKANAATQAALETQKTTIASIESTAHGVWTNVMQGGQDAFKRIGQTIKAAVLDLLYQLTIKKWVISIAASVTGGVASASGTDSGTGSLMSAGKAVANNSSWFTDFGGSSGSSINQAGGWLYNKGFEESGAYLIENSKMLGDAMSTAGTYLSYATALYSASQGKWGAAAGTAIGSIWGPVGAAIGNFIGGWVDKLAGNTGARPSVEGGYASAGTQGSANGRAYVNQVYGGQIDLAAQAVVDSVASTYQTAVKALGGEAGVLTAQSFIGMNQGDNGNPNKLGLDAQLNGQWLYNRWTDQGGTNDAGKTDAEMSAAVSLSTKKIVIEALKATDLGKALNEYLDTVVTQGKTLEEITATMDNLQGFVAFRDSVKSLPFDYLTNASVAAAHALIVSAGSFESFQSSLGNYVDKFYTDAEKTGFATKALTSGFANLGITMPAIDKSTREWYKSQVALAGAQDLSIQANADQYNSLLGLATAVDSLAPAAEAAAAATVSAADTLRTTVLANLKAATSGISSILKDGMLGKISKDDLGGQLADAIGNGLQDAMAQTVADQIATAFTDSIITPIIDAVLQGAAISSAVSQSTIDGVIAAATARMQSLEALLSDSRFQALLGNIRSSLGGSSSAAASNSGAAQGNNGSVFGGSATQGTAAVVSAAVLSYAQQHAAIDAYNAFARANPIESQGANGQISYRQQQAFHLTAEDAASQLKSLQDELDKLTPSLQTETARRAAERYVVDDSNLALYDRVQILKDEAAAADLSKTALAGKKTWQDKLDVLNGTTTDVALQHAADLAAVTAHEAEAQAQLLYVTDAAARAVLMQTIATDEATKAIINQVYAQQAAAQAAAAAAQVAATRQSWQDKFDVLSGRTTDRALQMQRDLASTTDATTLALIHQYYAQLDLADAAAAAAKAAEEAAAAQAAAVQAAKDSAIAATDAALAGVQRAVDAQKKIAQAQLDVAKESVGNLTTIFNTLKSNINDLYGSVSSTAGMGAARGQEFIAQALAAARSTGYMPDATDLADAITGARKGVDSAAYTTKFEADKARLVLAGQLDALKSLDETQLTAAEQAAKAAQDQLDALDAVLAQARAQVDAIRGVDTSVQSVSASMAALAAAILAERSATAAASSSGATSGAGRVFSASEQIIQNLYTNLLGRQADNAGLAYWTSQLTTGATRGSDLVTAFASGAARAGEATAAVREALHNAGVPGYAVGTPYVPQDGLAYLHEGEAVIPARFNNIGAKPSNARDDALVGEIRGLREENQAQARAMVQMQTRLTKLMERWDGSGMPETRVEA